MLKRLGFDVGVADLVRVLSATAAGVAEFGHREFQLRVAG